MVFDKDQIERGLVCSTSILKLEFLMEGRMQKFGSTFLICFAQKWNSKIMLDVFKRVNAKLT